MAAESSSVDTEVIANLTLRDASDMIEKAAEKYNEEVIIALTHHSDARIRKRALKELCPCRVKDDVPAFWTRVLEMVNDEDEDVRFQVLHTLCDGSPAHLEQDVMDAVGGPFNRDTSKKIRRAAHKIMGSYKKSGKWNIM